MKPTCIGFENVGIVDCCRTMNGRNLPEAGLQEPQNGMKKPKNPSFHQKSYVCIHVFDQSRPVLLVSRDGDDWCFLCGDVHPQSADFYRVVGLGHVVERDPSLCSVLDLLPNEEAERIAVGEQWIRTNLEPE